ncbi:sigma 54-interacting transcriptional regulator [Pseudomonas syringae]|uniref:sigma 54-interacting transcriptional regulator n=1 Tax=Pseudomonas syringae TaxID=317 RepID=UPI000467CDCD|nr:sigma-54 dependent transcriptional regulator [Pseudomonas syringae]MBI6708912.1 sigma-54-dependent Fis family transcriptional regulator [Pseudomonas syringae]OBS34840.1 AAA family ATPase [Pseudomonas syringae pv. syringae]
MSNRELSRGLSVSEVRTVGVSPLFLRVIDQVDQIAPTAHTVLITGPSGAGKEVIAQRLHRLGGNAVEPFVDINCATLPAHLVEAELFGHNRGAFTGATSSRIGHFEAVGSGTLFLDEIGELPLALQPVLLRVLETRSFRPVGSNTARTFNGRVVAATHRNLRELVDQGLFREDLYYRLAVFEIDLPGLDQRPEDVVLLVQYFASRQSRPLSFTPDANALLVRQRWPGHVRQLRNLIERLSVLADSSLINAAALQPFLDGARQQELLPPSRDLADDLMCLPGKNKLAAVEHLLIDRALQIAGGNKSAAAQLLGVGRKVIERRLRGREHDLPLRIALKQASQAIARSEFQATIQLLQIALNRNTQTSNPAVGRQLFEAHRLMGVCYRGLQGWLSPDARACDEAALHAGADTCGPAELAALQFGVWSSQLMALDLQQARATAQAMLRRAQASGMPEMLDEAQIAFANTLYWLGDNERCLSIIAQSGLSMDVARNRIGQQGINFAALALTLEGLSAFHCGFFTQARKALDNLRLLGTERFSAFSDAVILQGVAWLACLFEEEAIVDDCVQELLRISRQNGFTFYLGVGQIFQGWYMAQGSAIEAGLATIVEGYENQMLRHGGHLFYSFQILKRGELLLRADRPDESEGLVNEALGRIDITLEKAYQSDLMVIRGRSILAQGNVQEAERVLRGALSTAFAAGSVSARIAAATYLAHLLIAADQHDQACEILDHATGGIPAHHAPPILSRSHALLATLLPTRIPAPHN